MTGVGFPDWVQQCGRLLIPEVQYMVCMIDAAQTAASFKCTNALEHSVREYVKNDKQGTGIAYTRQIDWMSDSDI